MCMKFLENWMKKNDINANKLAKKIGVDRSLIDRWLGKTKEVQGKPQTKFDFRSLKKLRLLMELDRDSFYKKFEDEISD